MSAADDRRIRLLLEAITAQEELITALNHAAREHGNELLDALERCKHRDGKLPCECGACVRAALCLETNAYKVVEAQEKVAALVARVAELEILGPKPPRA